MSWVYDVGDRLRSWLRGGGGAAAPELTAADTAPALEYVPADTTAGQLLTYTNTHSDDWALGLFAFGLSGLARNRAIEYSTLTRCVTLVSATVAQLVTGALDVVGADGRRSTSRRAREVVELLATSVDGGVTPAHTWVEDAVADYCLDGNALLVPHVVAGSVRSIARMTPWDASLIGGGGRGQAYRLRDAETDEERTVAARDVLHVRWPQLLQRSLGQGFRPGFALAPVVALRPALEIGIRGDEYIRAWFSRGAQSKLHVDFPPRADAQPLTREQREEMRDWVVRFTGGRQPLVTFGGDSSEIKDSPQDREARSLREYQVADVARLYGVPAPLLGVEVTQWGQGIEQLAKLFWRFGARHHVDRFLAPLQARLLDAGDRFLVDTSDMLRGDADSIARLLMALQGDAQRAPVATREELRHLAGLPADVRGEFAAPAGADPAQPAPRARPRPIGPAAA